MGQFILKRVGVMILTALCLTFIVFFLTNLYPNLEKLAKTQGNFRMPDHAVATWLSNRGYRSQLDLDALAKFRANEITEDEMNATINQGFDWRLFRNYGEWLGVTPGYFIRGSDDLVRSRCFNAGLTEEDYALSQELKPLTPEIQDIYDAEFDVENAKEALKIARKKKLSDERLEGFKEDVETAEANLESAKTTLDTKLEAAGHSDLVGSLKPTVMEAAKAGTYCGILQGNWGYSTQFKQQTENVLWKRLRLTGFLMACALLLTVPAALVIGVLAGMREGSRTDRTLSTMAIGTSATPEYVTGVVLIAIFSSSAVGLKWFKGSAASAMDVANFENFLLPVLTIALFSIGYIARMTRASMAEVMTAQYIRTARLKGVSFPKIVMRHALRNALIAPFTVIILQIPYLLTGVVITERLFNYKGFGWLLVESASNNDINVLLGVSVISVVIVLLTQLISDIGYVILNPRIRIS